MCAGAGTSESSRFSVNNTNHSGKSRNRSSDARLFYPFDFCFGFWVNVANFLLRARNFAPVLDFKIYMTTM